MKPKYNNIITSTGVIAKCNDTSWAPEGGYKINFDLDTQPDFFKKPFMGTDDGRFHIRVYGGGNHNIGKIDKSKIKVGAKVIVHGNLIWENTEDYSVSSSYIEIKNNQLIFIGEKDDNNKN